MCKFCAKTALYSEQILTLYDVVYSKYVKDAWVYLSETHEPLYHELTKYAVCFHNDKNRMTAVNVGELIGHVSGFMVRRERFRGWSVSCCFNVMCTVAALQKSHSPAPCLHRCCRVCWILTLWGRAKDSKTFACSKHIKCVISANSYMNAHAVCVSFHMYRKCMHAGKHLPRLDESAAVLTQSELD